VEQILASKPSERRALVEEAAGLGRFKRRRHRAELKLGRVATQVERARDLEQEVRKRLRPLALQASAATRAEKLAGEIEALRIRLAAAELEQVERRLAETEERRVAAAQERRARDERLAGLSEERRRAEEELEESAGRHERATAALYRLRSALERVELRRERAEETARSLRAEAAQQVLPEAPAPSFTRVLTAARGWEPTEIEASVATARVERARAGGRDAVLAAAGGKLWFAAENARRASPEDRAGRLGFLA
jgi:chromosome segregation ATPase